jgi:hypothetical protein
VARAPDSHHAAAVLPGNSTPATALPPPDKDVQMNDTEAAYVDSKEDDKHSTQQDHSPDKATASSTDITPTRNKAKSTEVHEKLALLQFEDVKETLKMAGFVFKKNRYYCPGALTKPGRVLPTPSVGVTVTLLRSPSWS